MRKEYILIFDDIEQSEKSITTSHAIDRIYRFLSSESEKLLSNNPSDSTQIIKYRTSHSYSTISKSTAKSDLISQDEIEICLYSAHQGAIAKAEAIDIDRYLTKYFNKSRETKSIVPVIKKYQNDVDYKMREWKQTHISPIAILRRAEAQIFAFHFMKVVEQSQIPLDIIDKQCEFADGTCEKLLDYLDPLIPTKIMIEKISRSLKMKPDMLWLSLVEYYMGGKQAFREEINQV